MMPYHIAHDIKGCSGYAVVKNSDGKIMGCHKTKAEAVAQLRALEANEADKFWGGTFTIKKFNAV
jgi:hypothetical protein